jgi:hypothetical protein
MRRNLFLYLALACFLALITIFVADGYMGVYDTIYVTSGEQQQVIEPDYWLQQYPQPPPGITYYISAQWGQKVFFRYEIDNRRFASYSTVVGASVWQESEKVLDLFSEAKSIEPFDKVSVEWTLSTENLGQPAVGASNQYTVKISDGEVERNIVVDFYYPQEYPVPPPKY